MISSINSITQTARVFCIELIPRGSVPDEAPSPVVMTGCPANTWEESGKSIDGMMQRWIDALAGLRWRIAKDVSRELLGHGSVEEKQQSVVKLRIHWKELLRMGPPEPPWKWTY